MTQQKNLSVVYTEHLTQKVTDFCNLSYLSILIYKTISRKTSTNEVKSSMNHVTCHRQSYHSTGIESYTKLKLCFSCGSHNLPTPVYLSKSCYLKSGCALPMNSTFIRVHIFSWFILSILCQSTHNILKSHFVIQHRSTIRPTILDHYTQLNQVLPAEVDLSNPTLISNSITFTQINKQNVIKLN